MSKDGKYIPLITVKEKTNTEPAEFIELCTAPCEKGAKVTIENEQSTPISITGSMTISEGLVDINLGAELNALSTFSQDGLVARIGVGNYIARTITSSSGINITNGDGIADNPLIELGTVPINKLLGYPNNNSLFLNGSGIWSNPLFVETNDITYRMQLNNTNLNSYATGLIIQKNAVDMVEFGFNNSTDEAYVWGVGSASLKFGTDATKRMEILSNGYINTFNKFTFFENNKQIYIRASSNYLDLRGDNVRNSKPSAIIETNAYNETASIVMNGDYIQTVQTFDDLGFIFTDEDNDPTTSYQSYISSNGSLVTASAKKLKQSIRAKKHKDYLERLNKLNIYSYSLKTPINKDDDAKRKCRKYFKNKQLHVGLLSEEVNALFDNATDNYKTIDVDEGNKQEFAKTVGDYKPEISETDYIKDKMARKGDVTGIKYDTLVCYMILAIQELTARFEKLEKKIMQQK